MKIQQAPHEFLTEKRVITYFKFAFWVGILFIGLTILTFLVKGHINFNDLEPNKLSAFGDFIGGFIGVIFTITTVLLVYQTYKSQKEELKLQREELAKTRSVADKQAETLIKQQFESTFFNMLNHLNEIISSMEHPSHNYKGRKYLKVSFEEFKSIYKKVIEGNYDVSKLPSESLDSSEKIAVFVYEEFYMLHHSNLGHYFRFIYNILKLIHNADIHKKDKDVYIDLLQAQMSHDELGLIFYDAISQYGANRQGEKKFKKLLDDYEYLRNIGKENLLDRQDHKFYPNTIFKFLSEEEAFLKEENKPIAEYAIN